ncbi:MAG: response regulator transcription factor [Treponema sp.]|nr:response regulator transcription factor [Treponema sp.]
MNNNSILIIDDEKEVIEVLSLYLQKEGFFVRGAYDGEEGLSLISRENFDCILLDVMLPKLNGFHIIQKIREKYTTPVIMISAKVASSDKILGLDLGADDYITKPFDPLEVVSRIKANIRRGQRGGLLPASIETSSKILAGSYELDIRACKFYKNGQEIEITSTEFHLLKLFINSPNTVFTKQQIIEAGWSDQSYVEDNSIMVALSKLRSKLDEENPIKNIRGLGYRLEIK